MANLKYPLGGISGPLAVGDAVYHDPYGNPVHYNARLGKIPDSRTPTLAPPSMNTGEPAPVLQSRQFGG